MSQFGNYKKPILDQFQSDDLPHLQEMYGDLLLMSFEQALGEMESPIEAQLLLAFFNSHHTLGEIDWVTGDRKQYFGALINTLQIAPQLNVNSYRLDFGLTMRHPYGRISRVAVECDGHEFHERTKRQASRDKKRDRELALSGWKVLRFTGSEIHKEAEGCAAHVLQHIENDNIADWQGANP